MTCSGDKNAAEEESRKKGVPCFRFDKVSYNARYTNIREVKKPLFRVLCLLASPASIWVCRACGMRFLRYACISCVFWLESACDAQNFFQLQRPAFCTAVWVRHTHYQRSVMLCICDGIRLVVPQVHLRIGLCPWCGVSACFSCQQVRHSVMSVASLACN